MMLLAEAALRSSLLIAAVWLALALLRVRNPYTQMTAWSGVLLASLAMPLLMRWVPAEAVPVPFHLAPGTADAPSLGRIELVAPDGQGAAASPPFPWLLISYLTVALSLTARLGLGVWRSLRLLRRASRVRAGWTEGRDVRLSLDLAMPAAIGRTILLPVAFLGWDTARRRAVLAHEASHVDRGDFTLLLLAALHRALFWFNPLSWWLHRRLADLAEANSDAAALAVTEDRLSYAQTLLDLAGPRPALPGVLAMAAHATVRRRVERILAERALPARLTLRKAGLIAAALIPAALAAAGATTVPAAEEALIRQRLADQARPRKAIALEPAVLDKFVGYYALPALPDLPFKVWREEDRLVAATIGQNPMPLLPESDHLFFAADRPEQTDFQIEGGGRVTGLVVHENGYEFPAARISDAAGREAEAAMAERIAADRPQPGGEAALRAHIDQIQRGQIDEASMVNGMGHAIQAMLPQIRPEMIALGPVTDVRFDSVGQDGMDIYVVTHAHGARRWQIRLTRKGQIESLWFSPL